MRADQLLEHAKQRLRDPFTADLWVFGHGLWTMRVASPTGTEILLGVDLTGPAWATSAGHRTGTGRDLLDALDQWLRHPDQHPPAPRARRA